jgi:hypothetical protein
VLPADLQEFAARYRMPIELTSGSRATERTIT